MESGALSDQEFPAFAKDVVPFLHVTTRIKDRPYDGLLSEKGFRGFPSLAFMDAEGNVIARQSDRSVAGFRTTLTAVQTFTSLKERAAKGDKKLAFPLLAAEWELGMMEWETLKERLAALGKLSKDDRAKADQLLLDAEVLHLMSTVTKAEELAAVAERYKAMLASGYTPGPRAEVNFWSILVGWADEHEDLAIYEKAATFLKARFGQNPDMAERVKALDKRLEELRAKAGKQP